VSQRLIPAYVLFPLNRNKSYKPDDIMSIERNSVVPEVNIPYIFSIVVSSTEVCGTSDVHKNLPGRNRTHLPRTDKKQLTDQGTLWVKGQGSKVFERKHVLTTPSQESIVGRTFLSVVM
jgi:hypothetical protein